MYNNNEYFASGISYGTMFTLGMFTPSKCKKCNEYPTLWNNDSGIWQVECKCGRVSDKMLFVAVMLWNNNYGDNSNWTAVIDYIKDQNNSNNVISNYQFEKCCCDCIE